MNAGLADPCYPGGIGTYTSLRRSCYIECMHGSVGFIQGDGRVQWAWHATQLGETMHHNEKRYIGTIHRIVPVEEVVMLLLSQ